MTSRTIFSPLVQTCLAESCTHVSLAVVLREARGRTPRSPLPSILMPDRGSMQRSRGIRLRLRSKTLPAREKSTSFRSKMRRLIGYFSSMNSMFSEPNRERVLLLEHSSFMVNIIVIFVFIRRVTLSPKKNPVHAAAEDAIGCAHPRVLSSPHCRDSQTNSAES